MDINVRVVHVQLVLTDGNGDPINVEETYLNFSRPDGVYTENVDKDKWKVTLRDDGLNDINIGVKLTSPYSPAIDVTGNNQPLGPSSTPILLTERYTGPEVVLDCEGVEV